MFMLTCVCSCSKPVAKLYGQNSPVFRVQVDSVKDRVYSIGNDNTVNVSGLYIVTPTKLLCPSFLWRFGTCLTIHVYSLWFHLYTSSLHQLNVNCSHTLATLMYTLLVHNWVSESSVLVDFCCGRFLLQSTSQLPYFGSRAPNSSAEHGWVSGS